MLSVILVYVAGVLIARADGHALDGPRILWGLAVLLLVSLSIHYVNEYADIETDALTKPTRYSGGSGVLPSGIVSPMLALQAAWVTLIAGILLALILTALDFFPPIALPVLVVGAFFGWMYSLPPLALAWRGWGELDNAILGGILLHLYGYAIVTETLTLDVLLAVVPFTMLTFNNLLATTWADRDADFQVGKYTLATQWSRTRLRRLYTGVAMGAFALLVALREVVIPSEVVAASFLALPMVIWGWLTYTRIHAPYPTSNAMVVLLLGQMAAWYSVGS